MRQTRRTWLRATAAAIAGVSLAGCQGSGDEDATPTDGSEGNGEQQADGDGQNGEQQAESENGNGENEGPPTELDAAPEDVAIAAEWNAIRTRLRDPVILGHADLFDAGETVTAGIFERSRRRRAIRTPTRRSKRPARRLTRGSRTGSAGSGTPSLPATWRRHTTR